MFPTQYLVLAAILLCSSISSAVTDESSDAKLLVSKVIFNNYIVEGQNLTVKYTIYNIGNMPALNVNLQDANFPKEYFEYVEGFNSINWLKVPATTNVTHTIVVKPHVVGLFNITHAVISYLPNEKTSISQIGYSTELGQAYIQSAKEYNRRFASHAVDWAIFGLMSLPSIVLPFCMWFQSKTKYEIIMKNNKKDKTN